MLSLHSSTLTPSKGWQPFLVEPVCIHRRCFSWSDIQSSYWIISWLSISQPNFITNHDRLTTAHSRPLPLFLAIEVTDRVGCIVYQCHMHPLVIWQGDCILPAILCVCQLKSSVDWKGGRYILNTFPILMWSLYSIDIVFVFLLGTTCGKWNHPHTLWF